MVAALSWDPCTITNILLPSAVKALDLLDFIFMLLDLTWRHDVPIGGVNVQWGDDGKTSGSYNAHAINTDPLHLASTTSMQLLL